MRQKVRADRLVLLGPPHLLAHLAVLVPSDLLATLFDDTAHYLTSSPVVV